MQLYTPIEIQQLQENEDLPYLNQILEWVKTFLGKPHPLLGRPGAVCPFVPHSIRTNSIRLAVIRSKDLYPEQIENLVKRYRDIFLEMDAKEQESRISKAFLLIFPDIDIEDAPKIIDSIQQKLKPLFVESGLMIGEFHKRNQSPGLHNPDFRPLRSPVPLLAIRFMVEADLPFLQSPVDLHLRIRYLEAYLKRFGGKFTDENRFKTAYQVLALAKAEVEAATLVSH
ncbi:hypothetical protein VF14_23680 [Nostoc linckia z18]|jgi:hypothetical protein|uniref:DUF6875 domain-containing protein n=3 Tax=Nostoc TaxID=1177 RepID=A0A9Q5ZEE7_NOSLI|nr:MULTISPECIES: hypothetical protein [Nostoc]MBL1203505.1 hypothetical protein [Nostoc sp. GBBB01]MDZ8015696.1 hypothetical protein [Nostoc sp. ZfuVER08]PHK37228.1 hypothetical protein VF12_20175 [Nostoc linckia z15]PHK43564.1 hypothetical protein VF13_26520 [Nostoc linckia z16]MBD2616439.1 hypothetical protein [Nostoc punctiforme FACHB-252]